MGILAFTIVFFAVNPELTSTNRMCYFVYLLVFAAAQIFGDQQNDIDNYGHAGGFVTGLFVSMLIYPKAL